MIYILLTIIAVGILLVSKEGKAILRIIAGIVLIGLILCLILWYVIPTLSQYLSQHREDIEGILLFALIVVPISIVFARLYGSDYGSKKIHTPLMSMKIKLHKLWQKSCNIYGIHPGLFILFLLGICILIAVIAAGILGGF